MTDHPAPYPERVPDVVGAAELTIRTSATEVLEFILDVQRYRAVDPKIGAIHWVRRSPDGREVTFRFTPRLGPLPAVARSTLAPPLRLTVGPVLRRWLARDVPAELAALRRALEGPA